MQYDAQQPLILRRPFRKYLKLYTCVKVNQKLNEVTYTANTLSGCQLTFVKHRTFKHLYNCNAVSCATSKGDERSEEFGQSRRRRPSIFPASLENATFTSVSLSPPWHAMGCGHIFEKVRDVCIRKRHLLDWMRSVWTAVLSLLDIYAGNWRQSAHRDRIKKFISECMQTKWTDRNLMQMNWFKSETEHRTWNVWLSTGRYHLQCTIHGRRQNFSSERISCSYPGNATPFSVFITS